ncbi:NAD(P)H-dependent flavin oxidoreductase [Cryobacterium tepidiphilum]|uniref:Propionate 3-nitronate monooxygenase n=1 Tax=Cryobacterium tepidiphilum TaxID=2486026 RepID=A0A3M8LFS2_9MICO|nr:nitronate monooxygenase [Cryobacterium tepidiphilum]RNE64175.1 nitronate monooxygenase [Cryobacterium tepidiphilum]
MSTDTNTDSSWQQTDVTRLLGLDLPIVLAPFGGVSSVELAATVSNRGGLGSYGLYGYGADRIAATARELAAATAKPFALNLWLPLGDSENIHPSQEEFDHYLAPLTRYFEELGLPLPERPAAYLPAFEEQFEAVLEARPAVLSLVFGAPTTDVVERAHERGIRLLGTATTVEEAVALDQAGVDAIVATGAEAGGHRVSFLRSAEDSLVGTFALVPQVVDAVSVPVIAAGGIADGRGLAAALVLGAGAAQIGSAFLATRQSAAASVYRDALRGDGAAHTVLTRALSGRLARGIPNRVTTEVDEVAPFPVQNWLTGRFRPTAGERGIADLMSLWAGQGTPLVRHDDANALIDALLADAGARLA